MTEIGKDHVEWAVVDRMRLMLLEPPHHAYNVTQAYSLFTCILCWVLQHARIRSNKVNSKADRSAAGLWKKIGEERISVPPWSVATEPTSRIEVFGGESVRVPAPVGFEEHTASRFLINLRNAVAHGNARNVSPFNIPAGPERLLAGFTFRCSERGPNRWGGRITLLEDDLRRIGVQLATRYCEALDADGINRGDRVLPSDTARSIREVAA